MTQTYDEIRNEVRKELRQELNWEAQEENWKAQEENWKVMAQRWEQQSRHDKWIAVIGALSALITISIVSISMYKLLAS